MAPPVPGRIPIKVPIREDFITTPRYLVKISLNTSTHRQSFKVRTSPFSSFPIPIPCFTISAMAKRPITAGISSTPPRSPLYPKVKRTAPVASSMPIIAIKSPRTPAKRPLATFFPVRLPTIVRPHMANSIISGGPNRTEIFERTGVKNNSTSNPIILPTALAITEKYKARLPSPRWVIG